MRLKREEILRSEVVELYRALDTRQKIQDIYKKKLYGLREFTEFYHHKFNIKDDNEVYSEYLNEKDISKIILSWNNGICDYSFWSKINRNIFKFSNIVLIILNAKIMKNYKILVQDLLKTIWDSL